jgi:outer membrane protein assembly factor BamD
MSGRVIITIAIAFSALVSCSEYQKVLKTTDMQYKYDKALEYYKAEKFTRAYPLLEELYITYRGSDKGEKIAYYHANCEFKLKDYISASHHFEQFTKNYPGSAYAEPSAFLSAYCTYKMSPKYSLDQTDTYSAISAFQLFAIKYGQSTKMDSVNVLLDELRLKLEFKDYKAAMLYFDMERYKAAKVAFDGFNGRFPNSKYKEETAYLAFKSAYLLALNSVEEKKSERIEDAIKAYHTFADRFTSSKYLKEASVYVSKLNEVQVDTKKS